MTTARIVIDGDVSPLRSALAQGRQALNQFGQQATSPFRAIRDQLGNLGNIMAGLGAIRLGGLADQATLIQARLKDVTGSTAAALQAQSGLYQSAQRLQVGYDDMAGSFAKMLPAVKELGGGAAEATRLAEIMAATSKLSGASSAEASASAQQFAQALASGVLQGDELKSILENNGTLSRALAQGLGVGVGELKRLGAEGKLTSEVVANALLGQYDELMARSAEIPDTMGGAWTQVQNAFQQFVGAMNEGTGAFAVVGSVLKGLARFIDTVRELLSGTGTEADKLGKNNSVKAWGETVGAIFAYIVDVGRAVWQALATVGKWVGALAASGAAALSGDFATALGIIRERAADTNAEFQHMKELLSGGVGSALRSYALRGDYQSGASGSGGTTLQGTPNGNGNGNGGNGKRNRTEPSQLAHYEAALAAEREFLAVAGETRRLGKEQELDYWRTVLRTADLGAKDRLAIQRKVAGLEVQVRQEAAQRQQQIDADAASTAQQLALLRVDGQRIAAQALLDDGQITQQQMLQMELQFEQQRYQIQRTALEDRLALLSKDPTLNAVEMARLRNEVLVLEQQQANKMAGMSGKDKGGGLGDWFGGAADTLGQALDGLLSRTQTWAGALQSVFASLRQSFITNLVTEPLKAWVVGKAQMLAQELGFAATKQAIDATTSATTIGFKGAETAAVSSMNAVQAGTGAASAMASIPYVGPVLALAAMAAVFAAVSSLGGSSKVKSARDGYDIPAGVNPLTQLHEEEMVLPKGPANVLRDLAAGGGAAAGGGGDTIQISVQAMDPRSFERWLSGPGGDGLVRALNMRRRDRRA